VSGIKHDLAITPLLQSHILEFSNNLPFERAMDLLQTAIPSAKAGASQAQRLVQHFGHLPELEELLQAPGFDLASESSSGSPQILYTQVDGGHLLTDDGCRETKVGRLFGASYIKQVSTDNEEVMLRNVLEKSDYLAHMGHYEEFVARLNPLINNHLQQQPQTQMIVVSDGADWISRWLERDYPQAQVILDFYHAAEKMCEFAKMVFKSDQNRKEWIEKRKAELLAGQVEKVILAIRTKALARRVSIVEKADAVIQYYQKNKYRMQYDKYRKAGYCIGSGAIESAISTVVQQRCKLVGQRWTERVAAVLNLRAAFKSDKRKGIRQLINHQMGHQWAA
jgi:hypothetical protein